MDLKDIKEALPFAFDQNTRTAFFSGFTLALSIGFAIGFVSCRFFYLMIRGAWIVFHDWRVARRAERERKERECQEKRKCLAEHRRREKAFEGLILAESNGYYLPADKKSIRQNRFCRNCLETKLKRVAMETYSQDCDMLHCPVCGAKCRKYG